MDDNCCRYFERLGLIISDGIEQRFYVSVDYFSKARKMGDGFFRSGAVGENDYLVFFFLGEGREEELRGFEKGGKK